jgi:stringent starvation protein B
VIAGLWARFSTWIVGVAIALAGVAAVYLKGRSTGKQVEQERAAKRDVAEAKEHAEKIREASNVQATVTRLPDTDVHERLRRKWRRD